MVWLLSNWWHVAEPLPPAAWSPEQGSPCVHVLLTSSAGEVIHLKSKHRLPSPLNWLFFSARSVPQNGSLTGCRNSCAGPEERVTQAQRWYPSSFISPISQISKWSRLPDLHTELEGKPVPAHGNPCFPIFEKSSQNISQPQNTSAHVLLYTKIVYYKK